MGRENLNYRRGRSGRPYERLKTRVYATETHCCLCGEEVDLTLPYLNPMTGRPDPWSKSIEHTVNLADGGDPYDGHLAHRYCNIRKGASDGGKRTAALERTITEIVSSPGWT